MKIDLKKYCMIGSLFVMQTVLGYTNIYTNASVPTGFLVNDLNVECAVFTTKEPLFVTRSYLLQAAHILSGCWNLKTLVFFGPPVEYEEYGVGRIPAIPIIQEMLVYAEEIFYSNDYCDKWRKILDGLNYKGRQDILTGVSFDANGGEVLEKSREVMPGQNIGTLPIPTRSGYVFVGWYTAKVGGVEISELTKVTGNTTYYARWGLDRFTLVLHKNDGTDVAHELTVKHESPILVPDAVKTLKWAPRRGFSFMGWATAEKSKNVFLKDQEKVTTSLSSKDTLHVYAIWQLKPSTSYAVQYIRNDGSGSVRTIGFNGGIATKLNSVKALGFERRGYTFVGWATSTADARAKKVWKKDMGVVSQPVANGKLLQIYAIWKLTPGYYSIRFNKNDGSGKWRELGYKYGDNTTLPTIENGLQWSRAGYKFGGWATSAANAANGIAWRGDKDITRTPVAAGKTLNVYAIWKKSGAAAMSVNTTFALSSSAQSLSSSSGANEPAKLLPGYYSGELADSTGTYDLLVDEDGETGYVHILFDDGSVVSGEVEVDFLDDIILVTEEAEELYLLMR